MKRALVSPCILTALLMTPSTSIADTDLVCDESGEHCEQVEIVTPEELHNDPILSAGDWLIDKGTEHIEDMLQSDLLKDVGAEALDKPLEPIEAFLSPTTSAESANGFGPLDEIDPRHPPQEFHPNDPDDDAAGHDSAEVQKSPSDVDQPTDPDTSVPPLVVEPIEVPPPPPSPPPCMDEEDDFECD